MRTVVGGQLSVVSCQLSVVSGQLSVVGGQWSVVGSQWSVVGCRSSVISGQNLRLLCDFATLRERRSFPQSRKDRKEKLSG